jgi:hypothetical protein
MRGAVATGADIRIAAGLALLGGRLPLGAVVELRPASAVSLGGDATVSATDLLATGRWAFDLGAVQPYAGLLAGVSVRGWRSGESAASVTVPVGGLEAGAAFALVGPLCASAWVQARQDLRPVLLSVDGAEAERVPGTEARVGASLTFALPIP